MFITSYQKRKNNDLIANIERKDRLNMCKVQNYYPIYNKFFNLTENNYESVQFEHQFYLNKIVSKLNTNENIFKCELKKLDSNKKYIQNVFFKKAPLLDPYKYLTGKYNIEDKTLFNLPHLDSSLYVNHPKISNSNNSSYIDGFFVFLTSNLLNQKNFVHGLNFYGSFIGIKNNLKINVFDDLEHLHNSDFFKKNKDILYEIDDYGDLFCENEKLEPINIDYDSNINSSDFIENIDDNMFGDVFKNNLNNSEQISDNLQPIEDVDLIDNKALSLKSTSTCSSRVSNTSNEYSDSDDETFDKSVFEETLSGVKKEQSKNNDKTPINNSESEGHESEGHESEDHESEGDESEGDESDDDEILEVRIKNFPINLICMENCEETFDNLIMENDLSYDEWFSALMQVIMMLITYQNIFSFTHNDLHTNNIMFNKTDKKFLYYKYKTNIYKVPTYGRIFKIIDFGRSIYKCNNILFCSDSFQPGEDAATQYNTEPFLNTKKPRLDPNYSFDLCRLACSIFDYIIEDIRYIKQINKCNPIQQLIYEWCQDDSGLNILYKHDGEERYPDFKLYKMIARHVHNHTPESQLSKPCFNKFLFTSNIQKESIIDIDYLSSEYKT